MIKDNNEEDNDYADGDDKVEAEDEKRAAFKVKMQMEGRDRSRD